MIKFLKNRGRHNDCPNKQTSVQNNDDETALQEAENFCLEHTEINESRSRLSRNLLDILAEQSCICYFVQFLEYNDALPLIKFWLDVESFKAAAESSVKKNNLSTSSNETSETNLSIKNNYKRRILNRSVSSEGYDSLSYLSVDCDSLSANSFSEANLIEDDETTLHEAESLCSEQTEDEKCRMKYDEIKDAKFNSLVNSDAVRIYRKYLISNSIYYIEIPATILSNISLALCGGNCNEHIFEEAQHFVLELLENNYLCNFLDSSFYCKYIIDVLTSENLCINDILYSETALFYFMEYLEQEHKRHYLEFWMSATNFKKTFDEKQAQSDALILYEKYFSLQATNSLFLSDKIRYSVEEAICSVESEVINSFNLPIKVIERFLEQQYFKKFTQSQLFCKYLAELYHKVQENSRKSDTNTERPNKSRHRKTFSDVTNDKTVSKFISSQNTLLAMDTSYRNKKGAKHTDDIMHFDSRQLYNPDLLWKRDAILHNGLTFGRINSLGRYERDFDYIDVDDDHWGKSKLKKAMRKLINLPEDKAQEELAWQVAEMIVKDITDVTLSNKT